MYHLLMCSFHEESHSVIKFVILATWHTLRVSNITTSEHKDKDEQEC